MARFWTCQKVSGGVKCGTKNPARNRKCMACLKTRPKRKEPAHKAVLRTQYEIWVKEFGEVCGICGRKPTATRRLDRDHCHTTGDWRGLLCARCNRALPNWMDAKWLRNAIVYLERTTKKGEI